MPKPSKCICITAPCFRDVCTVERNEKYETNASCPPSANDKPPPSFHKRKHQTPSPPPIPPPFNTSSLHKAVPPLTCTLSQPPPIRIQHLSMSNPTPPHPSLTQPQPAHQPRTPILKERASTAESTSEPQGGTEPWPGQTAEAAAAAAGQRTQSSRGHKPEPGPGPSKREARRGRHRIFQRLEQARERAAVAVAAAAAAERSMSHCFAG
ncbi:hypothetical protein N656DRAFT_286544 [Canariomyces notabilis]|uniref:Uncharacterized protein n=1 Tax=Canariomyces notabilis TaxID=2074819 RepID=A0AAN6TAS3_9PEZI|nr:hypothetical protein N656DRAFT_286544 [Canariomyces arenarius]